jgi:lysophospholipase L1-like esterase
MNFINSARGHLINLAARLGGGGIPGPVRPVQVGVGDTLVSMLGDSLTEGWVSASFVRMLERRLEGRRYRFQNAGVGGDFVYNLRTRLGPVIDSCPSSIIVLAGTNDAQYQLLDHSVRLASERQKQLPQSPGLGWFGDNLLGLVETLQQHSQARIGVCSIPPLGEDLEATPNQQVRAYNEAILATAQKTGVSYLPVFEAMQHYLDQRQAGPGTPYCGVGLMGDAMWEHFVLRKDWDTVGAAHGYLLHTDGIHLNLRGAIIIADLLEDWLVDC